MEPINENVGVDKALYEIYEEGILNRTANRISGAASNLKAKATNAVNSVKNAGTLGANIYRQAKTGGQVPATNLQPYRDKIDPNLQQQYSQINKLVDGFTNDASKLGVLDQQSVQAVSFLLAGVLAGSKGVDLQQNKQQSINNALKQIIGIVNSINYV